MFNVIWRRRKVAEVSISNFLKSWKPYRHNFQTSKDQKHTTVRIYNTPALLTFLQVKNGQQKKNTQLKLQPLKWNSGEHIYTEYYYHHNIQLQL
jgi:hypothetical protein